MAKKKISLFEARYFGMIIGLFVFLVLAFLRPMAFMTGPQQTVMDLQMQLRNQSFSTALSRGANLFQLNKNVSQDILLVGVDTSSLNEFGNWPWPRFRHADFLNYLARIQEQNERESSVMLDFFFFDGSKDPGNDVALSDAIQRNGRTFLEGVLLSEFDQISEDPETVAAFNAMIETHGSIQNVKGSTEGMRPFYGMMGPVIPFVSGTAGYGHATFTEANDKLFRSQILVAKVSRFAEEFLLGDISRSELSAPEPGTRFAWFDKEGFDHTISQLQSDKDFDALIAKIRTESPSFNIDNDGDGIADVDQAGNPIEEFAVYKFREYFIPSITLSLALQYFDLDFNDVEVVIGSYIRLHKPSVLNKETGKRESYRDATGRILDYIEIPIDSQGAMRINFMGPRTPEPGGTTFTYNIRPYSGYSQPSTEDQTNWPPTLSLKNSIVLAGAFSAGMADDEKNTPVGPMYGVEVHANALNGIIMNSFIHILPEWTSLLVLFAFILAASLISSRMKPPFALIVVLAISFAYFWLTLFVFEQNSLSLDYFLPTLGMVLTMVGIIAYRVMTEEREKRRIQGMFGKYVSPAVVDEMIRLNTDPELGGVDKNISVLFSDIRGFTTLSESMSPQELVNHLNIYLTAMTDTIHEFEGTLDKYVGDEIMCFWGAPLPQADHALLACKCAIRQMERLHELNQTWPLERRLDIGIGINSGIMTVGNMGSSGRMNYTLMGDNVNLGARLEGTNKQYGTHIIISENTYALVKDHVIVRELDNIRVKGKNKPVQIYELVGIKD